VQEPPSGRGDTVISAAGAGPAFLGAEAGGRDIPCRCGRVLATAVTEESLWDLILRCQCGATTSVPSLPRGQALPRGRTVVLEPRIYSLDRPVELGKGCVTLGRAGLVRYAGLLASVLENAPTQISLTPDALMVLVEDIKRLLGKKFEPAWASHQRGVASATPPRTPARPIRAIASVLESVERLTRTEPRLDISSIVELVAVRDLASRWQRHPLFDSVGPYLLNEYSHAVIALLVADFLVRAGNGVAAPTGGAGRGPDLRVCIGAAEYVPIEIKVPRALQEPPLSLDNGSASAIVAAALEESGTGRKGQLRTGRGGVLVVGGFHLGRQVLQSLERAAETHLLRDLPGRDKLSAIAIASLGVLGHDLQQNGEGDIWARRGTVLNPSYDLRLALNPRRRDEVLVARPASHDLLARTGPTQELVMPGCKKIGG
jgi:hypothetical protein